MALLFETAGNLTAIDDNGDPVPGALIYAYSAGTTTPVQIYSDAELSVAHSGVANAAGRFAPVYLAGGSVKIDIKHPTTLASLPGFPQDNIAVGVLDDMQQAVTDAEAAQAAAETAQAAAETAQAGAETARTGAQNAQAAAETAQGGAENAQAAAETAQTAAETAADAAFVNADVYADTAAGLAATTVGDQFQVVSGTDIIRYSHDSGPVATEVARYSSDSETAKISDEYSTSRARHLQNARLARGTLGKAAVIVLTGQSLNAWRGSTAVKISAGPNVRMFVGGATVANMDFFATNNEHTMDWNEVSSAVEYVEASGGQSPCVGIASMLLGGMFERVYVCSVAVGARTIGVLSSGGPRANLYAAAHRLCQLAIADGYDPQVSFCHAQGEADASAATGESTFFDRSVAYLSMLRLLGQQAMGKPGARVPIVVGMPVQSNAGSGDRDIKEALRRVALHVPDVMLRTVYNVPQNTDLVHPTEAGYVLKGEGDGLALRDFWESGILRSSLKIVDATWDGGTTGVAYFNEEITRDTSLGVGASLSGTDGFEWIDNGTPVTISSIVYAGRRATFTLASTPSGSVSQQVIRIASQQNTPTATAPDNVAGSYVRRSGTFPTSLYDPTFTHHAYAIPQAFDAVRTA